MTRATTIPTTERAGVRLGVRALILAVPLLSWAACASAPPKPPVASREPARALHRGPPSDFVSAAGLRWLVLVRPRAALADTELGPAILQIVSARRFDAFAATSGVELRDLPSAAVAGYAYSTLYLAELASGVAERARARFGERLLTAAVAKRARPGLVRIGGVIGQTPETLVTVEDRTLAVAVGDPMQATVVEAYAEERLKNSPSALQGAALSSLPALFADNTVVLFAPGPFADEWQRAAGGLLQSAVSVAVAARPVGDGKLAATIVLAGAWGDSASDAGERLRAAWASFARSSAGRLFELPEAAELSAEPELLTLRVDVELSPLVRGLRASVLGDVSEIMRLPARTRALRNRTATRHQERPHRDDSGRSGE